MSEELSDFCVDGWGMLRGLPGTITTVNFPHDLPRCCRLIMMIKFIKFGRGNASEGFNNESLQELQPQMFCNSLIKPTATDSEN